MRGIVGICIAALILILGLSYLAAPAETGAFALGLENAFRIIRPLLILSIFAAWFPLGRWLHEVKRLSDARYALWRKIWAPALIWYVLIEIGIGQGRPVIALGIAALYGAARVLIPRLFPPTAMKDIAVREDRP